MKPPVHRWTPGIGASRRLRAIEKRKMVRTYTSSQAVDVGLGIYRRIARLVLPRTLGPMALCSAALLFIWAFAGPALTQTNQGSSPSAQFGETVFALCGLVFVALPLLVTGFGAASAPVISLASQAILGEALSLKEFEKNELKLARIVSRISFDVVLRSSWLPIATVLVLGIAALMLVGSEDDGVRALAGFVAVCGFGLSLLLVPILLKKVALAPIVALVEEKGHRESLVRAAALSSSHNRDTTVGSTIAAVFVTGGFLYLAMSGGVSLLISAFGLDNWVRTLAFLGPFGEVAAGFVSALPFMVSLWLLTPLWGATMTVLYYDRRVRLEGLDIEILAKDILQADRQTALLN
jgi:hypothetical protein